MGFIDRLDDVLTQARGSHAAQREAARFARSVRLGTTYYYTATHNNPEGEVKLVHEIVFDEINPITKNPMCGPVSAAGAWLRYGPLTTTRPRGLQTLGEYTDMLNAVDGPNITGNLRDHAAKTRARAGR